MIKFLHCADIHLDSPFASESADKAEIRRSELRGAFTSMMMYAKLNKADFVLMAGDLFDTEYVTKETVSLLQREFSGNPDCKFIISPGNHDPYTDNSVYRRALFPANVFIFNKNELSYLPFNDIGVNIYGYAFTGEVFDKNPIVGIRPGNHSMINILCAHADLISPISKNCPISVSDLQNSNFDYVALGHIHNSSGIEKIGKTYYGYSGCLEGRDYGEIGYKGAVWVEIDDSGTLNAKGIRFSKRRYELEHLDVTGAFAMSDIITAVKNLLNLKHYSDDTLLKLILDGNVSPELTIKPLQLKDQFNNLFELVIEDRTVPLFDYDYLVNDISIRGEFFRKMLPLLKEGTSEEREVAAKALRYGLSAISGNDIIDFTL